MLQHHRARSALLGSLLAVVIGSIGSIGSSCTSEGGGDPLDFGAAKAATAPKEAPPPPAPPRAPLIPPSNPGPVGTNLAELREYTPERPFNDLFKQARAWISTDGSTWDTGKPIALDAHGWVKSLSKGQFARALVLWGDGITFPKGTYTLRFKGKGTVDLWPQGGFVKGTGDVVEHAFAVDPKKGGIAVTIRATDIGDPIRDIEVLVPGVDASAGPVPRFNTVFLDRLKGYSVLRFMDWMETNHSVIEKPGERPTPTDATYTGKGGVPIEVIVDLCNTAQTDCWINVGHTWDDALIEAVATVAKEQLQKNRRLYVESSNEVWNGIFPQATWAKNRAIASEITKDTFEGQMRYHARRTAKVHAVFAKVFGAESNRVVRVLGAWASNAWSTGIMLDELQKQKAEVDVVAIAPYFGGSLGEPEQQGKVQGMALGDLMTALDAAVDESLGWVKEQKKVCDAAKIPLVAYEGGQHLAGIQRVADDPIVNRLFDAANESPKMKAVYLRYLEGWQKAGGGVFLHFNSVMRPGKYGRWGALTSMEQPRAEAPKYDALMTFIEQHPG